MLCFMMSITSMDSLSLGGDQLWLDNLAISTATFVWLDNHLGYKFPFPAPRTPKTLESSTGLQLLCTKLFWKVAIIIAFIL